MTIRKLFRFEAAHRVLGAYTERCQSLHGHSYLVEVFLGGQDDDGHQMLLDFKLVKEAMEPLIEMLDHSTLCWREDAELCLLLPSVGGRYAILPYSPTAEQLARHFYFYAQEHGLPVVRTIVHETTTGYAEFSGDDPITFNLREVELGPKNGG